MCPVCLLIRNENFALLHNDYVHGGFCQSCAEHLMDIKANCPICREEINKRHSENFPIIHFHIVFTKLFSFISNSIFMLFVTIFRKFNIIKHPDYSKFNI